MRIVGLGIVIVAFLIGLWFSWQIGVLVFIVGGALWIAGLSPEERRGMVNNPPADIDKRTPVRKGMRGAVRS